MALTENVIVNQVFVGASTAGGFSLGDLRTLGFFEANEPVSLGSCFLDYRDTNFMAEYNKSDATGVPKYYSYWDESHLVFAPVPNATYTIQLNYILKPQGLSSTNATTYLSQKFPNGLLYACLVEAYGFLKGPLDMLQHYDKKYVEAVKGFSIEQMGRRRRDEYQSGVPRIGKQ
mgnify:CR=1 FL=1